MALLALYAIAGCGGSRAAAGPAPVTATTVERAEARERERAYDEARALYAEAVEHAPDAPSRAWAARQFADALLFWGEHEAAERQLEISVRADDGDASAWHDLGLLRHRRRDIAGAERALRRARALAPADPRPRIALAALLVNARRLEEALAEYRALLALERVPERTRSAIHRAVALIESELSAGARGE